MCTLALGWKNTGEVPKRYSNKARLRFDSVGNQWYVDMRHLLVIRLLSLNRRAKVKAWIGDKKSDLQSKAISIFDKSLLDRLWR